MYTHYIHYIHICVYIYIYVYPGAGRARRGEPKDLRTSGYGGRAL